VLVAVACSATVVLTACGGGQTPLSRAAFERRANEECATLQAASEALRGAQEPGAVGAEVAEHVATGADRLRRLVTELGELTPPEAIDGEVDELVSVLGQYADGLDGLAERTGPDQTFQDVLDQNTQRVAALNDLADRSSNLVQTLGLAGCMLAS
jgi:hypothetical protein